MPQFAANLSMMYVELPFLERFGATIPELAEVEGRVEHGRGVDGHRFAVEAQ